MVDPSLATFLEHIETCCIRAREVIALAGQFHTTDRADIRLAEEKFDEIEDIREELEVRRASLTFDEVDDLKRKFDDASTVMERIVASMRRSVIN